ncbi:MAG: hypothetical protein IJY62_05555 [Clostridia bacterium]|nr:hypothetical protein [Clostridia bacterium]
MFLKKDTAAVKTAAKKVVYKRFSFLQEGAEGERKKTLYGVSGENCNVAEGGIKPFLGVREYPIDGKVVAAFADGSEGVAKMASAFYTDKAGNARERVIYVSRRGTVFWCDTNNSAYTVENESFPDGVNILPWTDASGKEQLIFCGKSGAYLFDCVERFSPLYIGEDGASAAACVFHDRLFFASKGCKLRFCAPLAPTVWEADSHESGALSLSREWGEIVGLAALKERLYVFFARGIARLDARGAAKDFVLERLSYGGGEIFPCSVGEVDGRVYFLATDGVYRFDGDRAQRAFEPFGVAPKKEGQVCDYTVFEGRYFLDYTAVDGSKKRLVVDGRSGEAFFMTATPTGISGTNGRLLCFYEDTVCAFSENEPLPEGEKCFLKKGYTDFGIRGRKLLRSARIKGRGNVRFEVSNGYERHGYTLALDGERTVFPLVKGERFSLSFELEIGSEILGLELGFVLIGN